MYNLVDVVGVNKAYDNKVKVFENFNLSIRPGRIIGLLGPNGSGKTTLIKLLAGLLKPDQGDVMVNGVKVGYETKAMVSYLPERTYFNENLKVKELVGTFVDFYPDFDLERAYGMMSLLGINPDTVLKKLSKGNKEKVQLIMVMSRRAKLYLLDEPIAGVDPAARDYILQTILSNYDNQASIIISTHLIYDIESILDDVIFIKQGNLVVYQDADTLRSQQGKSIDEMFREVFRC